jgi:Fe-S cluster biogenesis protein NfuA
MTITIYAPESEGRPERNELTSSPRSLAGLRIAVLDNGKPNAATVMSRAAETLAARTGATVALVVKKGPGGRSANAAIPCADDIFRRVLEAADVVITGAADCGSCTAYSVYDAISFEKAGRPAIVVTTTKFEPIAATMAADFGMPDVRTLVLPHPLGGTDRETLWRWADDAVERLEALFVASPASPATPTSASPQSASASPPLDPSLAAALDGVRALVREDGSDLRLLGVDDGIVRLRLEIEDASCADCVMPRDVLEQVAQRLLSSSVPSVRRVEILDPRVAV